jgi:hypothetical protein
MQLLLTGKPTSWESLIEARLRGLVKPNLEIAHLETVGELQYLQFSKLGDVKHCAIDKGTMLPIPMTPTNVLSCRGIFGLFKCPLTKLGETTTVHAWGLSRDSEWLHLEVRAEAVRTDATEWEQNVRSITLRTVTLHQLLLEMKILLEPNDGWETCHNRPEAIWYGLGGFIHEWKERAAEKACRSCDYDDAASFETASLEAMIKSVALLLE